MIKIAQNKEILDQLIDKSEILKIEQKLDKYLCLILITELLFGAKKLNGQSKPVECVRSYEDKFQKLLLEIQAERNLQQNDVANIEYASNNNNNDNNKQANQNNYLKPRYIRVNTNLMSRNEAIDVFQKDGWQNKYEDQKFNNYQEFLTAIKNLGDYDFLADLHVNNLFIFPASSKRYWAGHYLVLESKLILQDKASCLPSMLLNPSKKSVVLDMCAAPGMKTTHLSAIMKDKGRIYAVEQNERRYQTLLEFIRNAKSSIVVPMYNDCLALGPDDLPKVEYILIDPPCSGSGMTNRLSILSSTMQKTPSERLSKLAGLQIKMLTHALQSFPNAKKIVYSTCSINPEENEEVIQRCLQLSAEQYGWELIKPPEFADLWKNFGSPKYKHIGKKCIYAKSSEDFTDGFFVAILERKLDSAIVDNVENINETMFDESHADDQQNINNYNNNQYNVDDNIINENIQTEADEIYEYNQLEQSESKYNEQTKNKLEHLNNVNVDENNEMEPEKKKRKSKHNDIEKTSNKLESSNNVNIDKNNLMEQKKKKKKLKHTDIEQNNNKLETTSTNVEIKENNQMESGKKKKNSKQNDIEQANYNLEATSDNIEMKENNQIEPKKKKKKLKHTDIEQTNNKLEAASINVEVKINNQIEPEKKKRKSKHTDSEQINDKLEPSNNVDINHNRMEEKKKKRKSKHNDN